MRPIDADALLKKAIQERRFVFTYKDLLNDELVVRTVYKDLAEFIQNAPTIYPPKTKWISVEERLPDDREYVIVAERRGEVSEAFYCSGGFTLMYDEDEVALVTHWMPMPEPPEKEE